MQLDELAWASLPLGVATPWTLHCRTYYVSFTALAHIFFLEENGRVPVKYLG